MQARTFLMINGFVVALLVYRLFAGRRPQPTSLRFDLQKSPKMPTQARASMGEEAKTQKYSGRYSNTDPFQEAPKQNSGQQAAGEERSLNCWFQFNGHTWDAYEVLGLPAGSDRDSCYRAYLDLRRNKPKDEEFLKFAWEALSKR